MRSDKFQDTAALSAPAH